MLNKDQRAFLMVGVWATIAMVLFPPWAGVNVEMPQAHQTFQPVAVTYATSYQWIWYPTWSSGSNPRIDAVRLLFQLLALWVFVGGHMWCWMGPEKK